ncbi:hypothetical protein [Brevibacillus invocatus]|uniref:hypothetical protein n=1 Tax=Brevibacillus invocatus TaxID=173959 RepID=UPI00203CCAEB|nr:hypothetical protein [Brevibacillus invocatus]MCM3079605.1 hypothetical protein [Brevibacillus invocatus]MCM3429803.1 hypothetical protein [Brevibacillus invocatus]
MVAEMKAKLAFEKDKDHYQKLAEQRALLRSEEFLANFKIPETEMSRSFAKKSVIKACRVYELERIINRLKHRETIRTLYPESLKAEFLKKWPV